MEKYKVSEAILYELFSEFKSLVKMDAEDAKTNQDLSSLSNHMYAMKTTLPTPGVSKKTSQYPSYIPE